MIWTPIGSPSSLQWSGSDIAGCPVRFATAVNGVNSVFRRSCSIGPSTASCQAIGTGGSASVGVTTTSVSLQNETMRRAIAWSCATARP